MSQPKINLKQNIKHNTAQEWWNIFQSFYSTLDPSENVYFLSFVTEIYSK